MERTACLMKEDSLSAVKLCREGPALLCRGCCVYLIDDSRSTRVPQQPDHLPFESLNDTCKEHAALGSEAKSRSPYKACKLCCREQFCCKPPQVARCTNRGDTVMRSVSHASEVVDVIRVSGR